MPELVEAALAAAGEKEICQCCRLGHCCGLPGSGEVGDVQGLRAVCVCRSDWLRRAGRAIGPDNVAFGVTDVGNQRNAGLLVVMASIANDVHFGCTVRQILVSFNTDTASCAIAPAVVVYYAALAGKKDNSRLLIL